MNSINPCAIIAEYNPFHNGHLYHISKTRELLGDVPIICIMSGNFTQRGEPAIADKWTRAKWAIEKGCDLIIELPAVYAIQSANRFAGGAVNIIKGLGCASHISFGCETDDLNSLIRISEYRNTEEYSFRLNTALKNGNSFARSHEIAISGLGVESSLLYENPNCILAFEYLSYLKGSSIEPTVIKRKNSHNDSTLLKGITSATSIRKSITEGNCSVEACVPSNVCNSLSHLSPVTVEDFFQILLSRIFSLKADGLAGIHEVTEGLENRIYHAAMRAHSLKELLDAVKTKRYLYTRLQRIMLYILLDITKDFMSDIDKAGLPVYARLLAINTSKPELLSMLSPSVPVISKAADYDKMNNPLLNDIFEKDILATQLYSIFSQLRPNEDFIHPIIKKMPQ